VPNYILTTQSQDRTGIVAALTRCLAEHEGFITELAQFGTPSSERFYSRISFRMDETQLANFSDSVSSISRKLELNTDIIQAEAKMPTLIMVSKFDHCLNDLLYRWKNNSLPIDIKGIASNHETSRELVETAGLPFYYIPITKETKVEAETALRDLIASTGSDLIVLARYMQILSNAFCEDYSGRVINIHHSFLPSFKGAKPYHRAYERGVKLIGATAHYVTADLDEGPIIEQDVARVDHTMTPKQLVDMGRDIEARVLARAVKLHAEHRSFLNGVKTVILP
jgi:formyltetrahydrofolate deformylase